MGYIHCTKKESPRSTLKLTSYTHAARSPSWEGSTYRGRKDRTTKPSFYNQHSNNWFRQKKKGGRWKITGSFTIVKRCKQPSSPLMDQWIHKIWCIHATEYYPATKKHKVLIHATTWMNLRNTLSEKSQTPKVTYCVTPFIQNVENRQIQRENRDRGCWGLEGAWRAGDTVWSLTEAAGDCTMMGPHW